MTFLYTARGTYDKNYGVDGKSWQGYIEWSNLIHLTEVVSLDYLLNENLVKPDYDNADDWDFFYIIEEKRLSSFVTSIDYVFKRIEEREKFNLLTVVIEPEQDCNKIVVEGFEFVGYDLLDKDFGNSALTNCGGFDEAFLPNDLNDKGLIDSFEKAYEIKNRLIEYCSEDFHADTNVIAIWRHKTIGR